MPEQPPPSPWVSQEPTDRPIGPVRRSGVAVAAVVLGVLAIPLALTVYLGALTGLLALLLGLIGLFRTRRGRATGRGMAVAGLIAGLVGLVLAVSLGVYGMRTYRDCETRLGHSPSSDELRDCTRTGG
jgi:hypothetical protein